MPIFRKPETPEEIAQEAEAKAQVLAFFGIYPDDGTMGEGSKEIQKRTWVNLFCILLGCVLYTTGAIGTTLYLWIVIPCLLVVGPILAALSLYFARQDAKRLLG